MTLRHSDAAAQRFLAVPKALKRFYATFTVRYNSLITYIKWGIK